MPTHSSPRACSRNTRAKNAARVGLGSSLVFAGISHLTFARDGFQAQVPDWVPLKKDTTVVASGFVEIGLGATLLSGWRRHAVGKIAAAFFVAVFPGNIAQWRHRRDGLGLNTDLRRLVRLPFQIPLVATALWSTSRLA